MATGVTTGEAARRLGTTRQTVLNKIKSGQLVARQEHGANSRWLVEEESLQRYEMDPGHRGGRRASAAGEIPALESRVAALELVLGARLSGTADRDLEWADLRAQVVGLQEALIRTRAAGELQERIANERAEVAKHLSAALVAAQRADALQRQVIDELHEAVGSFARPGHSGDAEASRWEK
ncbi:MAG TPA: helix-turn-helix domain-containing protein [Streptosporangiaceae bacterium]|nr:helix-turn-helix domain-containing protein [Streptosporangiaceae bacterium]